MPKENVQGVLLLVELFFNVYKKLHLITQVEFVYLKHLLL